MIGWLGGLVVRWRWVVLGVTLVLGAAGGAWGAGVFGALTPGFTNPGSESARAAERIEAEFGRHQADLLVLYSSPTATVTDPAFRAAVLAKAGELRDLPEVARVETHYDTGAPALVSHDEHAQYLLVSLHGADMDARADGYQRIADDLGLSGFDTRVGGPEAILDEVNEHADGDLARAQAVTMPLLLLGLLVVLGSVVAALTVLSLVVLTILGAFAVTRLIAVFTEVSVFTVNIVMLLGLGLAISYAALVVGRFRAGLAAGATPGDAVLDTLRTAGRTVARSGLTVAVGLAALLLFPQPFLRSMGYGGAVTALLAALGALTVLPALLAVLGERVNAWRVPLARRQGRGGDSGRWARIAGGVTRRPVRYTLVPLALLALLTAPAVGVAFGGPDERVLPPGAESREVAELVRSDFPGGDPETAHILLSGIEPAALAEYTARVRDVEGVIAAEPVAGGDASALLRVRYPGPATGDAARETVAAIRDLPPPAGAEVLVGGAPAELADILADMAKPLPWVLLLMAGATFGALLVSFRSALLAAHTVVLHLLSVGASVGVLTWVFQEGHLSGVLDFTPTGAVDAMRPILLLAVLFALATDHQLDLLARVREEWLRGGDHVTAVTVGSRRAGRRVTSVALLLVMIAGFAVNSVSIVKIIGVGLLVALLVDVVLVRLLLAPATLRLLGPAVWRPGRRSPATGPRRR